MVSVVLDFTKYSDYISYAFILMSVVVAMCIISKPGNGAYKLSWVFLVLLFPLFGGLFYLFITGQRSTRRFEKKLEQIGEQSRDMFSLCAAGSESAKEDIPEYSAQINYLKNGGFPIYQNTSVKYLTPGEEKFKCLLEELEKAEKYIFLEYFIIQEGYMWGKIYDVLKRKANEGVDVRVIYDDMGCFMLLPSDFSKKLCDDGIKCVVFNPFRPFLTTLQNNRDHRKIAVIDGKVGFTGGINLADEYINKIVKHGHWKDASVMLKGEAVWSLTLIFLQMWEICKNKQENYLDYYPWTDECCTEKSDGYVLPYADSPLDNENIGEDVYLQIINNAKNYLYINTPYLIIDECMLTSLKLASKSGVDVRIVTPHIWDKRFVHVTTRSYYKELIESGIKIYEYKKGFIHSKTFVSDDTVATVGTINMDFRSLYLHFECGTCIYNSSAVFDVKEDFIKTLDECIRITKEDCRRNWIVRLTETICRMFAPLM